MVEQPAEVKDTGEFQFALACIRASLGDFDQATVRSISQVSMQLIGSSDCPGLGLCFEAVSARTISKSTEWNRMLQQSSASLTLAFLFTSLRRSTLLQPSPRPDPIGFRLFTP
jgi:hypothetical protein